mgnify:CR=1 FL=1
MIVIYGLKNCDSCRKAVKLMESGDKPYRFHDLRGDGLPAERLGAWLTTVGWEALLNRRSTTWRGLPDSDKADLDPHKASRLLARHPTLLKRPVIETGDRLLVGLAAKEQAALEALLR